MSDRAPEGIVTDTAFGNQAVDMRIPLEVTAKGMENHDKARSEIFRYIHLEEHTRNNTGDRMKETVEKRTVEEKKVTKVLVNGKDTMAVTDVDHFKGHRGSALHIVLITTGRTKAAVAAKRDKFKFAAVGTAVHGTTKRRVTTGE